VAEPQVKATFLGTPVWPFVGEVSDGTGGAAIMVVKLQVLDHRLVLPALVALTCQKSSVEFGKPFAESDVAPIPV